MATSFVAAYEPRIVQLNGTGYAFNFADDITAPAFRSMGRIVDEGLTTQDQFYYSMSNFTAGTLLPAWTDESSAYVPVMLPADNSNVSYEVATTAYSAALVCQQMPSDTASYDFTEADGDADATLTVNMSLPGGQSMHCADSNASGLATQILKYMVGAEQGRNALEISVMLGNETNAAMDLLCRQYIVAGWLRADRKIKDPLISTKNRSETVVLCKPEVTQMSIVIAVDVDGRVQKLMSGSQPTTSPGGEGLIAQANRFLASNGRTWHTDNFPSDFTNYLMHLANPSLNPLDPSAPVPSYDIVAPEFQDMYQRLFAIMVSINAKYLFVPADSSTPQLLGNTLTPETRIFVSLPAFAVSAAILALPWRILPRLPTTIVSTVAYFAAGSAVKERVCQGNTGEEDEKWGFEDFLGVDGRLHVGVEREPLLRRGEGKLGQSPAF
ncbi:hypothetical protein LTR95_016360 [Oleoguttula sp. CCFEE 5521]